MAFTSKVLSCLVLFLVYVTAFVPYKPKFGFVDDAPRNTRLLFSRDAKKLPDLFRSRDFWCRTRGRGVRIAILDSGIDASSVRDKVFKNVVEIRDFTEESDPEDRLGHGTFMAGIISGSDTSCPGLAPEAELYIFKVFNKNGGYIYYLSNYRDSDILANTSIELRKTTRGGFGEHVKRRLAL
eukprot:TRINITY_DN1636_c0_g1_i2.p5 TRINITY_DN1636_c0_g1~~TRINITY_DN1636_c0_g1_i2.p5  ORF type:complete len:182 (-),score=3.75 TRINITY_DN1636_c0_g1_i2:2212-2757(-)